MSSLTFTHKEIEAAIARGVQQCVVIGSNLPLIATSTMETIRLSEALVPLEATDNLADALAQSNFDKFKASLFVWLGGARYRSVDAALSTLSFVASLPQGSSVIFDYAEERLSLSARTRTSLDALASRMLLAGGSIKYLIQPQAVAGMLRGMGFHKIVDIVQEEPFTRGAHLVSATV